MQRILTCLFVEHDPWLVLLATVICVAGSWITIRLFLSARGEIASRRWGWLFLTGVAAGGSIWCTHFVAMLGYHPGVGVTFDPLLTGFSFFVSILGTVAGFAIASIGRFKFAPETGGALVGLAIAAMHYIGMAAYALDGKIEWNPTLVYVSIGMATVLGALSLNRAVRSTLKWQRSAAVALLVAAIVSLHFVGMAALTVQPFAPVVDGEIGADLIALAISIGGVGLLIIGMGITSYLLDASIRSESNTKLREMALHDTLTGLPNRAHFNEHLKLTLSRSRRLERKMAVVAIDLDRFKEINDQFGHDVGDIALSTFARRVEAVLEQDEFFARTGGDEFTMIRPINGPDDLSEFVARIAAAATERTMIKGIETMMGASLGVSIFPDDAEDADTLVNAADLAMYRAKGDRKNSVSYYEPSLDNAARRKRDLAVHLRHAVDNGALTLNYQVQKDIRTAETIGFEALVRWTHPELGSISPGEFIPLAEETGLIIPLGEWVLRKACEDAASWRGDYKVSVNISAVQLAHVEMDSLIEDILWKSGLSASRLEIEITESVLMTDMQRVVRMLRQVQSLGVTVAMDDFGTGYSSLANLQSFPFDKIKLDRAFIWKLENSKDAQAIIRAVLALGRSLDLPILAEGVETEAQRDFLLSEGCFQVQGFLYGRPDVLENLDFGEAQEHELRRA